MPLDPRIPMAGNPVQPVDLGQIQGQALAIQAAQANAQQRVQAAKDQAAAKQASDQMTALLRDSLVQDPETGVWTYDRNKIMPMLGILPPEIGKALDDADARVSVAHKAQTDALKGIAGLVDMTGNDPGFFALELERAVKNHQVSESYSRPILDAIKKDPTKVAAITGQLLGKSEHPQFESISQGSGVLNKQTGEVKPGIEKPAEHSAIYKEWQDAVSTGYKGTFEQYQNEDANRKKPSINVTAGGSSDDPKLIAHAIAKGDQPPDFTGLYRMTGPVRAELARQGYDLTKAEQDWKATQKYFQTLNGAQQIRLRQAVSFTKDSLDIVSDLANQWDGGKFPLLNKAQLALAKGGALGPQAQAIATKLDAQISDIVSELGTVYKGGNSSTDETLKLAAKNLQSDWSKATMLSAIDLIRKNLTIRENSIKNTTAVANQGNEYAPQTSAPPPARPAGVPPTAVWVPDPSMPGGGYWKKGGE
jgi:hypothetical protein